MMKEVMDDKDDTRIKEDDENNEKFWDKIKIIWEKK